MKKVTFWMLPLLILLLFFRFDEITVADGEASSQKEQNIATYTSTTSTTSKTIVLDAGHGGYDSGGEALDGTLEKDITLSITLLVGQQLEELGYTIVYTRVDDTVSWPSDNLADLAARVAIAQEAQADLYISFHTNSSTYYNDGASGVEAYVTGYDDTTSTLATALLEGLEDLGYTQNRGCKTTQESSLYVVDQNEVPSILLELGFLSDNDDAAYMESTQGQTSIAKAIVTSISNDLA